MSNPDDIKRKLRDLQARIEKTQESLEKARARIAPHAPKKKTGKIKARK